MFAPNDMAIYLMVVDAFRLTTNLNVMVALEEKSESSK